MTQPRKIKAMIILIASQKGGCGKSTLATNISAALAIKNKNVLLVDADKQFSASKWALARSESQKKQPHVHWINKDGNIGLGLKDLDATNKIIIVDTAGRDSIEMRSAMLVADKILIPSRPAQFDLETLPHISDIINAAKEVNESLQAFVVITMSPSNTQLDTQEAIAFVKQFDNIVLCNTIIGDRKIFRDSSSTGLSVTELPAKTSSDKAGKAELLALIEEII